jgi:putative hydrolase of the HAD superfamily
VSKPSHRGPARSLGQRARLSLPDSHGLSHEAVLFDALGTLVELEPPWPPLREGLRSRGIELPQEDAKRAMLAEMTYYKAHHHEGTDPAALDALRRRCAAVLREQLPEAAALPEDDLVEVLLASLRFRPYPDAAPALGRLRLRGIRSAVVSNWDVSLRGVLAEVGLGGLVDEIVVSAEVGAKKPDPAIVEAALRRLRCPAGKALMVGDSPETDVAGAQAAGVRAVLVDRAGTAADSEGVERIFTLEGLDKLLLAPSSH